VNKPDNDRLLNLHAKPKEYKYTRDHQQMLGPA
jgi:hypothetical protein